MGLPLPEPLPPIQDENFRRLQDDILAGWEDVQAGRTVSEEEMLAMFGIGDASKKPGPTWRG